MKRVCDFFRKYSHIWLLSYFFIYIPWFCYLEKTVTRDYHLMHAPLDSLIPFNEYFIIPYLLWFAFVGVTLIYFLIKSKEDYYRMCTFLFSGMTISLIICTFFENGTNLRPILDPDKNIFYCCRGCSVPYRYLYKRISEHPCIQFHRYLYCHP